MKKPDLTIRTRLLLGFGIAALLTLTVAIVAILNLRSLGEYLSSMAARDRLVQTGAIELRLSIEQESSAVRGYLLTGNADFLVDFTLARTRYTDKLGQLSGLGLSSQVAGLLSEVDSVHTGYVGIANEQSTLRDMGFGKAAVFLWQNEGNEIKSNLDSKLNSLVARQESAISSHAEEARQQQNRTLAISLALVLITWIAAVFGWRWTSRSITGPIGQLLSVTKRIGMGKLDTRVQVSGNDEFSTLGLAMNRMAEELTESRKTEGNLLKQEQRRVDQMRAINGVGRQIGSLLSLEELLPAVANLLQKTFSYSIVDIFLVDSTASHVVLKACQGGDLDRPPVGIIVPFREGIVGSVAESGETFLANDVNTEAKYCFMPEFASTRAKLAVPIKYGTGVLGVLDIQSTQVNAFDETDVFVVETLADQLAVAVHNAQLYQKARELATLEERQRLARDLHDAVSQTLFSSSLIADVLPRLWERNPEEGRRRLEEVRQLTRGALAEMRTLLLELRPAALIEADLPQLLRQLGESISGRARVPVTVRIVGSCSLPTGVKIGLYRITQEALNNVAKHAAAKEAKVNLLCEPGKVVLSISDNGRGFNNTAISPNSLGLGIMRERARDFGALLSIGSKIGQGTEVAAVWEYSLKEDAL